MWKTPKLFGIDQVVMENGPVEVRASKHDFPSKSGFPSKIKSVRLGRNERKLWFALPTGRGGRARARKPYFFIKYLNIERR